MRTTTFKMKLPIKYKEKGKADYDLEKKYSDEGFIPDWLGMEEYMKKVEKRAVNRLNLLAK